MPKHCEKLGYPQELSDAALEIVDKIHKEGRLEGCQPNTIVGVALFIVNSKLSTMPKFTKYKQTEQEIAKAVNKSP